MTTKTKTTKVSPSKTGERLTIHVNTLNTPAFEKMLLAMSIVGVLRHTDYSEVEYEHLQDTIDHLAEIMEDIWRGVGYATVPASSQSE